MVRVRPLKLASGTGPHDRERKGKARTCGSAALGAQPDACARRRADREEEEEADAGRAVAREIANPEHAPTVEANAIIAPRDGEPERRVPVPGCIRLRLLPVAPGDLAAQEPEMAEDRLERWQPLELVDVLEAGIAACT